MVKWLICILAVVAATSAGYAGPQQVAPEAPILPKGGLQQQAPHLLAPQSYQQQPAPQQLAPQPQPQSYAPAPQQQQPAPQPQPQVYAPAPAPIVQQQAPAPRPQTYAPAPAPQQQAPAPQQQAYAPAPAPIVQQQQPAPQSYAPAPQQQQPAPQPQPQTYAPAPAPIVQQQQPAPQSYAPAPQQQQPAPKPQTYAPAPQQNSYAPVQQAPPKPLFDCTTRTEGLYELGKCQPNYIQCVNGEAQAAVCPANLVFSMDRCEYKNDCLNPTLPPPPPQQQPPASGYGQQQQFNAYGQQPIQQAPPKPAETFCQVNNLLEGYHVQGCSHDYFACSPVSTTRVTCPAGLFYATEIQGCDYKTNVAACGGRRPTQPPAQTQPLSPYGAQPQSYAPAPQQQQPAPQPQTYAPAPQQQQPAPQPQYYAPAPQQNSYAPVQQAPPKPAETFCQENNLMEGYHAQGCSNDYFACSPASTTRVTCPAGLFYDTEIQGCDYKTNVAACGGRRPTQPPLVYVPPHQQQAPAPQPQSYAPAPAPIVQQQAPAPQSYAPAPQQQAPAPQPQSYAPAPQQQQPAPQPQSYAPAPQQNSYAPVQQAPPKPAETFCGDRSLSDGFYGKGCSSTFYVCAAGQTTRLECPTGLFYDQETNECGHRAIIVACGGSKPTQPPAQQPPMSGPYGQAPIPTPAKQPPPPPEFDCSARKDGIYLRGCTSRYFVCVQGSVMPLSCPTGTFYSAFTESCDYKAHVVECGGVAPTKPPVAQNPILLPQSPYDRRPQQPAQQLPAAPQTSYGKSGQTPAQQAPAQSNNPCSSLTNGIYGRKCSRFFFVCATQKTYDFICPKDHAFNVKTVKCAPKTEITTCPEFEIVQTPVQQTPSLPIEIKIQPQAYAPAPQQQQPAPQPQPQTYAPAPAPIVQQQAPAPQPQTYAPAPQQQQPAPQPQPQSYAPAPAPIVQQQAPAPQPQTYAPAPAPQQQAPAPQQQTYQRPQY